MKKQFWFVILFGFWCFLSAFWYFISVKGVTTDPENFHPHTAWLAILEILVMLLVACLIGYAIAWWLRDEKIENQIEKLAILYEEKNSLIQSRDEYRNQVELWREKHKNELIAVRQKMTDITFEKEKLQKAKGELEAVWAESKNKIQDVQLRLKETENEKGTLQYRIRQLEFQSKESDNEIARLKNELQIALARKEKAAVSDHPFVRPAEPNDKSDLTKIRGIGPFIEKRLNMIGIYTFEQLAELSPEMIDRVGAAIEFFPHRIIRDNWVGQAITLRK